MNQRLGRIQKRTNRGFSLIELLIVITIIALLAAILFPVFSRARENARRATCMSNLKQIGHAFAQYVQDHDGLHPGGGYFTPGKRPLGWAQLIHPYTKSFQIYQCPSESYPQNPYIDAGGSDGEKFEFWYDFTDYFMNENMQSLLGTYGAQTAVYIRVRDSHLVAPAMSILFGDGSNGHQANESRRPVVVGSVPYAPYDDKGFTLSFPFHSNPPSAMWRHLEGANYAFADGHVKWLRHTSISGGYAGYYPEGAGYCQPYPVPAVPCNAIPPKHLTAPYVATFAPIDYF